MNQLLLSVELLLLVTEHAVATSAMIYCMLKADLPLNIPTYLGSLGLEPVNILDKNVSDT